MPREFDATAWSQNARGHSYFPGVHISPPDRGSHITLFNTTGTESAVGISKVSHMCCHCAQLSATGGCGTGASQSVFDVSGDNAAADTQMAARC